MALVCSIMAIHAVNAQNESVYYGSKQGGFVISLGADPVLKYAGNMFNGSTDNSLYGLGSVLMGKYFLSDNFAIEAGVSFNNSSSTTFWYANADDAEEVTRENLIKGNNWKVWLGGSYLLRPGKRLQPFMHAYMMYDRGNDLSGINAIENEVISKSSLLDNHFNLAAGVGVEYYLGPKFSIEIQQSLQGGVIIQKSVSEYEAPDGSNHEERNYSRIDKKSLSLRTYSELFFNFYF